jgi:hypothetical protein
MTVCGREAMLLITTNPAGTSTSVARRRTLLRCSLEAGHVGPHRDDEHSETWGPTNSIRPTLLRHEDEDP